MSYLLLFLIEIHTNLQRICTTKNHGNSTNDLIFSFFELHPFVALIYI